MIQRGANSPGDAHEIGFGEQLGERAAQSGLGRYRAGVGHPIVPEGDVGIVAEQDDAVVATSQRRAEQVGSLKVGLQFGARADHGPPQCRLDISRPAASRKAFTESILSTKVTKPSMSPPRTLKSTLTISTRS